MLRIARDARIVVFAKAPQPGAVKTRLIPLLGEDGAAALQAALVEHTLKTATRASSVEVWLYCAPDTNHPFFEHCKTSHGVVLRTQLGSDLGERMRNAFEQTLQDAARVILIGSDCPALTIDHLAEADRALRGGHDAVFAPAEDGGYGLIALKQCPPELFPDLPWSEATLMRKTRARLRQLGWSWHELDTIWDVDRPADYLRLQQSGLVAGLPASLPNG